MRPTPRIEEVNMMVGAARGNRKARVAPAAVTKLPQVTQVAYCK